MKCLLTFFLVLSVAGVSGAVDVDENSMFGGAKVTSTAETVPDNTSTDTSDTNASGKEQPLQVGGIYYQQIIFSPQTTLSAGDTPLTMPLNLDTFLDGRPNDRIRVYIGARILYDPTLDSYSRPVGGASGSGFSSLFASSATTTTALPNNPQVVLDQAWLKFDLNRLVFLTMGKQHVKWGASRIWNPTDALNPSRRDPLQPYDLRLGSNMVKFDIPLGAVSGNLSAMALLDNPQPASTAGSMGAAFRAEAVVLGAEVGLDMAARRGLNTVYGADISAPLGPLDFYAESALLSGDSFISYELNSTPSAGSDLSTLYTASTQAGPGIQVSTGANYTFSYLDNRNATLGGEYFYNKVGSDSPKIYPVLIFLGKYQPFYAGKQYAALYLSAEGPDEGKKTSYNFSTIGNISDGSFVSRLDFSWLLLDYVTFGAFVDAHYGTQGGEFNFTLNTPALIYQGNAIPSINIPATPYDIGLSLRVAF